MAFWQNGRMRLNTLLDHLKAIYGTPSEIERQDAYRWAVRQTRGAPIHICLTLEQSTRRAAIWVLNPDNPGESRTEFLDVHDEAGLNMAIEKIDRICPATTST